MITVKLNEAEIKIAAGTHLLDLKTSQRPEADICILNGFPLTGDAELQHGDRVVMIQRGAIPTEAEMQTLLTARHTPGVHDKIKKATVGIAGVGGLGSAVAIALARMGIGRLIMADFDVVEPSNLNRQQFFVDQLGLAKVDALRSTLTRINPYLTIVARHLRLTAENIPDLFATSQVMVEAFDAPDQKAMLVETWRSRFPDIPLVAASGMAGHADSNSIATRKLGRNFYLAGDMKTAAAVGCGLMAPRVGIAAHHQANAVLQLLLSEKPEGDPL